jgi:hypothetical protein
MSSTSLESLTQSKFAQALNTRFRVCADPSTEIELLLVAVTPDLTTASSGPGGSLYESFSLTFHGPESSFLPQKTYPFDHPQLGKFELFIVPVGKEGSVFKYQAVFNRRIQRT